MTNNFDTLYSRLNEFINTKTVVGEPTVIGDITIVPLIDVNFGVAAGSLSKEKDEKPAKDNGAGGVFAKVSPSAILVINNGSVQLVNIKNQDSVNKIIDMVPGILSKFNLGDKSEENTEDFDINNIDKE